MPLSGNQRRYLRGLGHHRDPIVQVGHGGVTEGVVKALGIALHDHELVKVKLAQAVEDRDEAAEALAAGTGAEVVQQMGRTVLLYKPHPKKPTIVLPQPRKAAKGKPAPKGAKGAKGAAKPAAAASEEEEPDEEIDHGLDDDDDDDEDVSDDVDTDE